MIREIVGYICEQDTTLVKLGVPAQEAAIQSLCSWLGLGFLRRNGSRRGSCDALGLQRRRGGHGRPRVGRYPYRRTAAGPQPGKQKRAKVAPRPTVGQSARSSTGVAASPPPPPKGPPPCVAPITSARTRASVSGNANSEETAAILKGVKRFSPCLGSRYYLQIQ